MTSIGNCAFFECSSLTAVTLPKNLTSIGHFAFQNFGSL
ncbi:MAG: leucine-rich repeat domain-containing protein [Prevotellaceae bacterium]|nr:leucine-rich repeat domain-containing protein [Prevotellaceae bacterium]